MPPRAREAEAARRDALGEAQGQAGRPPGGAGQTPGAAGQVPGGGGQPPGATRIQAGPGPGTTPGHQASARQAAAQQRQPVDVATRLDGQRGWLNELDQSLRKRSIIALVLTCLAVGVGAAAIYIAVTKNADGDRIDALESRITALEAATGAPTGTTDTTVPPTDATDPSDTTIPPTGTTLPGTTVPPDGSDSATTPGLGLPGD